MRDLFKKGIALMLVFVFTLSCLFSLVTSVAAEEAGGQRFVFSALRSAQGITYDANGSTLTLALSSDDATFEAQELSLIASGSNAIYLALTNSCGADAVSISYSYKENDIKKTQTVRKAASADASVMQTLIFETPHIMDEVEDLTLTFHSQTALHGTVTLYALFNYSTYVDETVYEASFAKCHYDALSGRIEIEGTLSFEATAFYGDKHTLALFSLYAGEELHLSNKTPIARTGISLNFAFSVEVNSSDEIFNRYVVAAVNEKGERIPLCAPIFPGITRAASTAVPGYKGFHTQDLTDVIDVVPSIEIVDVYLDRLPDTNDEGILYAGEHAYYHFNQEYVDTLDRQVRNLVGMGTQVYLRFLISPDANGLSFTDYSEAGLGVVNKLPAIHSQSAQRDVYAMTDFLTSRYADQTVGRISGVILGRSADLSSVYSYTAADDMETYVKLYATVLNLVSGATVRNVPNAQIILPISDRIWPGAMDEAQLGGGYYAELFLPALLEAMSDLSLEPAAFSLMLESHTLPDRVSGSAGNTYGMDRLSALLPTVRVLHGRYSFMSESTLFCWLPDMQADAEDLKAAYLLLYVSLMRQPLVNSFIVDFSLAEKERADCAEVLTYLARYIDTDQLDTVAMAALRHLGVGSLQELYDDLSAAELQNRRYYRTALTQGGYTSATAITGSYTVWNFTTATGSLGWYAGSSCQDLSVLTELDRSRSLTARMGAESAFGDVAFHFAEATDLSFAPLIKLDAMVQGVADTRYEIQLRLIGNESVLLSSAIVENGVRGTLYLDLCAVKDRLSSVRGLRLVARPLDAVGEEFELHLYSFTLESDTLQTDALTERINSMLRGTGTHDDADEQKRDLTRPLVVSAVIVVASIAIAVVLVIRRKIKKSADKKIDTK